MAVLSICCNSFSSLGAMIDDIGDRTQIGKIEHAVVRRPVGADQTAAVKGQDDVKILQTDIMENLVVAALQKSRIDRHHRNVTFGRHAGGESHRMLFGDADVVGALGNLALQLIDARAAAHGRGDADDLGIFLGEANQRLAENIGVSRNRPFVFFGFAGEHVKRRDARET